MIRTGAKIVIGVGVAYFLYQWAVSKGQQLATQFGFQIQGYGSPGLNWPNLDIPVNVQFNNPSSFDVNLDNVLGQIFINKGGWKQVGSFNQPVKLASGTSVQKINFRVDAGEIFGGSILDTFKTALTAYQNKALEVRTLLTVTKQGITFPTQEFIKTISIG